LYSLSAGATQIKIDTATGILQGGAGGTKLSSTGVKFDTSLGGFGLEWYNGATFLGRFDAWSSALRLFAKGVQYHWVQEASINGEARWVVSLERNGGAPTGPIAPEISFVANASTEGYLQVTGGRTGSSTNFLLDGYVRAARVRGARAYNTGAISLASGTTILTYSNYTSTKSANGDTDGVTLGGGNTYLTVAEAGWYMAEAGATPNLTAAADGSVFRIILSIDMYNGATAAWWGLSSQEAHAHESLQYVALNVTAHYFYLEAGESVRASVYNGSGATLATLAAGDTVQNYCHLSLTRMA
jgi:hypothetical protein